jgi:hypothetical protein
MSTRPKKWKPSEYVAHNQMARFLLEHAHKFIPEISHMIVSYLYPQGDVSSPVSSISPFKRGAQLLSVYNNPVFPEQWTPAKQQHWALLLMTILWRGPRWCSDPDVTTPNMTHLYSVGGLRVWTHIKELVQEKLDGVVQDDSSCSWVSYLELVIAELRSPRNED